MTAPDRPIYIDQGNGTFKKYEGSIERLGAIGWPDLLPAGNFPHSGASVRAALDLLRSRDDIDADVVTLREYTEKDWETFKSFVVNQRAD